MDFLKLNKLRHYRKRDGKSVTQHQLVLEEKMSRDGDGASDKSIHIDSTNPETEDDDDDDDFITNEVKMRLRELKRNSFMVLIPEECLPVEEEEEEVGATSSTEWRDIEAEGRQFWSGIDAVYDIYCERMLFFDRLTAQQLQEIGSYVVSTPPQKSLSKKLASPLFCISLKNIECQKEENLQLQPPVNNPFYDIETAYVAQMCLAWETLHCQYTQLSRKICCQPGNSTSYSLSAQQFQQFQVLLQRFIENEPFEQGTRPEIYSRARTTLPKLLQVPKIQGVDEKTTGDDSSNFIIFAPEFIRIVESSIMGFHQFIKMDKKKSCRIRNLYGSLNQMVAAVEQIQSSLDKRALKLKEMWKRKKSHKRKSWPSTTEDVEMLLGLVDVKVLARVVRMLKITEQQLNWCEQKMKKLVVSDGKLQRDPSPILFPC